MSTPRTVTALSSASDRIPDSGDLLTTHQVAALLQVTPRTVRRWARDGVLPRVRIGGRITRYSAHDIASLIATTTSEAPAANQGSAEESADDSGPAPAP
jgi:excisionase family DNA binding protein